MKFALALITMFGLDSAYLRNQEGLIKFADKQYYPAYQSFLKALKVDPLNPAIHMNIARTLEANEEYDKAETAYKSVLKFLAEKSPNRHEVLFNLGGVQAKLSKYDEALASYQAALELVPDSKQVKTNIELLWQQGQGQGQGKDDNKDKKDQKDKDQSKDGQGQDKDKKDAQNDQQQEQKKQPRPFQSQELTKDDVKKILDEIKNQEQAIRAQEYEHNVKDAPRGKDW